MTRPSALRALPPVGAALAALAIACGALAPRAAAAQFAPLIPPPPRQRLNVPPAVRDSPRVTRKQAARDSTIAVQRLDIQAWVDSAAGALAREPAPPAVPPPSAPRPATPPRRARPVPADTTRRPPRGAAVPAAPRAVAAAVAAGYVRPCPSQSSERTPRLSA